MVKRDVLDTTMARRFAWRTASAADLPEAEDDSSKKAEATEEAKAAQQEEFERAAQRRDELAKQIMRVWQITPASEQRKAIPGIFRRAQVLGLHLVAMSHYPRESVLLWRLFVRGYDDLSSRLRQDAGHAMTFMPVDPEQRELVDLLVEVAEKGNAWLAFMMEMGEIAAEPVGRKHPDLGRRLARILDEGTSWESREIAARWLAVTDAAGAVPSLRRALVLPHAGIRWTALEILVAIDPPGVTAADVLWLLEDAVKHPLPDTVKSRAFDTVYGYGDALVRAVEKAPPPEGYRPLEIIADGEGTHVRGQSRGLDDAWALRALAAGYPERALERIDRWLYSDNYWRRHDAIIAAGLLPDELARPRLLEGACAPGHHTSEKAKALWFKRFGEACPAPELAGVDEAILAGPPSARFLSRLGVLRGSSDEATAAMLKALLAEAPGSDDEGAAPPALTPDDRETLALLLFSVRCYVPRHEGAPSTPREWTKLLLKRFGDPAFEGLARLAALGAHVGVDTAWMGALSDAARDGTLSAHQRERLRDVAAEVVRSPGWSGAASPLLALLHTETPRDLVDRVWTIATSQELEDASPNKLYRFGTHWAQEILAKLGVAPELDARIAEEGAEALKARAYDRLIRIVIVGCRRRLPSAIELGVRCIEDLDHDPEARHAAFQCGYALEGTDGLTDERLVAWLRRPDATRFVVATRLVRRRKSPAAIEALEAALASTAQGGVAAAEAAEALVVMKGLEVEDPRLDAILDQAPVRERASLAGLLVRSNATLAGLRRHIIEVLLSGSDRPAAEVLDDLFTNTPEGTKEMLELMLDSPLEESVRESIEEFLERPTEAERYFQDKWDDEDLGEDDVDEDDDSGPVEGLD